MASWNVNDQKIPQGRLALFSYVSVFFVVLLLVGFWHLEVMQSEHFADLAEKNEIRTIAIIAPRGAMLDREGRVLVDRILRSAFFCSATTQTGRKEPRHIEDGLGIDRDDLDAQLDAAKIEPKFVPVIIKPAASEQTSPSSNPTAPTFPFST